MPEKQNAITRDTFDHLVELGALELNDKAVVNEEFCIDCGVCIEMCPALAISA